MSQYEFPISIVLFYNYPYSAPNVSLIPSPGIAYKHTSYLSNNSFILPILQSWNSNCTLQHMLAQLVSIVSTDPPIEGSTTSKPSFSPYGVAPSNPYAQPMQGYPVSSSYGSSIQTAYQSTFPNPNYSYAPPIQTVVDPSKIYIDSIKAKKALLNSKCFDELTQYVNKLYTYETRLQSNNKIFKGLEEAYLSKLVNYNTGAY